MRQILLVEDDVHLRHSIKQLLEESDFHVVTAANGMEALLVLSGATKPDLIVLDLMMPTFSGWEFLRELRAHPEVAKTPVVVTSAFDAAPVGFEIQGFVRKPFHGNDFLALVQKITTPTH